MKQVFPMIPAAGGVFGVLIPAVVLMLAGIALFAYIAYSSRHVRFEVGGEGLRIVGDVYGRTIPARELMAGQARAMDLTRERDYAPCARANGVGLPGYRSGWFRLRNGEKALVFVTDARRVAYVPTRAGYSVLASVTEPERFVESLRTIH